MAERVFINGKRFVEDKDKKTERMMLLVRPNTKARLKKYADENGTSMNDLANRVFEYFLSQFDMGWKP